MNQKEFLRTSGAMLVLSLLEAKDMYGYEMIESLMLRSENVFEMKEGTLYPLLHRLEKQKLLSSYSIKTEQNRTRKYYKITDKGIKELATEKESWIIHSDAINKVMGFSV